MKFRSTWYQKNVHYLLLVPCTGLVLFFFIYPMIYQLKLSFYSTMLYVSGGFVGFDNYIDTFNDPIFRESILRTFYFISVSATIELIWGIGLALALNKITRGKRILRGTIIIPLMLAPVAVGSIWNYMYFPEGGAINILFRLLHFKEQVWLANTKTAMPALILVELWQYTSFGTLIILAGLQTIPQELYESAQVDGALKRQIFRYITLPLLTPLFVLVAIFNVMRQFKTFDIVYIISKGAPGHSTNLISYQIHQTAYHFYKIGKAAAQSFLLLVIVLILIMIFIRYIRKFY